MNEQQFDPKTISSVTMMDQIRDRIQQRRATLQYDERQIPTYNHVPYPDEVMDLPLNWHLYHYLRLANATHDQFETNLMMGDSFLLRIPLVGYVWQQFRAHFHSLANVYVKRAIADQININRHLTTVLNQLTVVTQKQQANIDILEDQVDALRRQLEQKQSCD